MKFLASRKTSVKARLPKPARVLIFAAVLSLFAVFTLLVTEAGLIYRRTEQTLENERLKQSTQTGVSFSRVPLAPHPSKNVQIIQNARSVRGVANYKNSLFAATGGGLLQLAESGEILRRFTVLEGLPESDLTALAVFADKLFIGTKSKGLISFDGERFEAFRLENHETKSITALFSDVNALLVGTLTGGLLEFDGGKITEIKMPDASIEHVTFLRRDPHGLIVGTFADGLWLCQNQIWKHFTTADGLFSNRIVGADIYEKNLFVAADLGVSEAALDELLQENQARFRQTFSLPTLSALTIENDKLYLTKDNGELFEFAAGRANQEAARLQKIDFRAPAKLQAAKIYKSNDALWLLSNQGVWKSKIAGKQEISLAEFTKFADENELSDNNISALAVDADERLWIGTFRSGIDVFNGSGKKLKHIESETVREINFLTRAAENNEILAATNGGAARFDADFRESPFAENAELPSRLVTQVSTFKDEKNPFTAVSTAKGLLLKEARTRRAFSSVNGLPANSVFSTLFARNALFVGTMSGLAQIEAGKIARVFKTSNSELKNNWISALCLAGERIFIGTYGGGIFELLPSGEIRSFESETGKFVVNPNALASDGERLFAGTLEGVRVLDLTTQTWSRLSDVVPSEMVLSITAARANVYFGTTNGIARINKNFWTEN
jgi:ligand-binding sensor domain-containing protein